MVCGVGLGFVLKVGEGGGRRVGMDGKRRVLGREEELRLVRSIRWVLYRDRATYQSQLPLLNYSPIQQTRGTGWEGWERGGIRRTNDKQSTQQQSQ